MYIWVIQEKTGRLAVDTSTFTTGDMMRLAVTGQGHLGQATNANAPSLRYGAILVELQQEAYKVLNDPSVLPPPSITSSQLARPVNTQGGSVDIPFSSQGIGSTFDLQSFDFSSDASFRSQLDTFPFGMFGNSRTLCVLEVTGY